MQPEARAAGFVLEVLAWWVGNTVLHLTDVGAELCKLVNVLQARGIGGVLDAGNVGLKLADAEIANRLHRQIPPTPTPLCFVSTPPPPPRLRHLSTANCFGVTQAMGCNDCSLVNCKYEVGLAIQNKEIECGEAVSVRIPCHWERGCNALGRPWEKIGRDAVERLQPGALGRMHTTPR